MVYFYTENQCLLGHFNGNVYFMTIWNILRPFGIFYGNIYCIVCDMVYFTLIDSMFGPRKIWQPWI
jgi:hypothetical protein